METIRPMTRFRIRALRASLVLFGAAALTAGGATTALAVNSGTTSGAGGTGCEVSWSASSTMHTALADDDATHPGLMSDPAGGRLDAYSSGGYIEAVRPELGDAGVFEINHWYEGMVHTAGETHTTVAATDAVWRVPIATDHGLVDARVSIVVPDGIGATAAIAVGGIGGYGGAYGDYEWRDIDAEVSADGLEFTVELGELAAGTGTAVVVTAPVPVGYVTSEHRVASATLTGAHPEDAGAPGCEPAAADGAGGAAGDGAADRGATAPGTTGGADAPGEAPAGTNGAGGGPAPTSTNGSEGGGASGDDEGSTGGRPGTASAAASAAASDPVAGADGGPSEAGDLPGTGADRPGLITAAAGALIAAGAALLLALRHRRRATAG